MNWAEMTPEQKDRLVAEKVMGWQAQECKGEIGEQPFSPDGWYCQKCGYDGAWGDDMTHEEIPPRYTQSLDAAWLVVAHIFKVEGSENESHFLAKRRRTFLLRYMQIYLWQKSAPEAADAICLAALKAVGVDVEKSPDP